MDYAAADDNYRCYDQSWGRHKARTRPVPRNRDYDYPAAARYFAYFGAAAGDPEKGYYAYDMGNWHILALNSEIATHAGGSVQAQWLQAEFTNSGGGCLLAYAHRSL